MIAMDRFAIYLIKKDGSRLRVIARAVDGGGYAYSVDGDAGAGNWIPYSPSLQAYVSVDERYRAIVSVVTSALALGVPPRLVAMEGLDEMPVWVVHEASTPAVAMAKLHERTQRAEVHA